MLTRCWDANPPQSLERARTYTNGGGNTRITMAERLLEIGILEEKYYAWAENLKADHTMQGSSDDAVHLSDKQNVGESAHASLTTQGHLFSEDQV